MQTLGVHNLKPSSKLCTRHCQNRQPFNDKVIKAEVAKAGLVLKGEPFVRPYLTVPKVDDDGGTQLRKTVDILQASHPIKQFQS